MQRKQNLSSHPFSECEAAFPPRSQQRREAVPPRVRCVRVTEVQRQQQDSSATRSFCRHELEELPRLLLFLDENVPPARASWPRTVTVRKRMMDL